ncbi:MAG TPA: hypothetical protein VMU33_03320 [Burkholderiaceae bacterium]|nr:hypothetical protein [Burkholderiaceae bacterium]
MNDQGPVILSADRPDRNAIVLTIASPAKNSLTQLYSEPVRISPVALLDLDRKLREKLRRHRIERVSQQFSIEFTNDRIVTFASCGDFSTFDTQTPLLTHVVTAKWNFITEADAGDNPQLHAIHVRVAERPTTAQMLRQMLSDRAEDSVNIDSKIFTTVSCTIDFLEGAFSTELLAIVTEWVEVLPRAEATSRIAIWLRDHNISITRFIDGVLPPLALLAMTSVWLSYLPKSMTEMIRVAVAWIIVSFIVFLVMGYFSNSLNLFLNRHLSRICTVPVFDITAGDNNQLTRYFARSRNSFWKLAAAGIVTGAFKGVAVYLVGVLLRDLFS